MDINQVMEFTVYTRI